MGIKEAILVNGNQGSGIQAFQKGMDLLYCVEDSGNVFLLERIKAKRDTKPY